MGFCKGIIGLAACLTIGHALPANGQDKILEEMAWSEDSIRHYAARMLMVGFKGRQSMMRVMRPVMCGICVWVALSCLISI